MAVFVVVMVAVDARAFIASSVSTPRQLCTSASRGLLACVMRGDVIRGCVITKVVIRRCVSRCYAQVLPVVCWPNGIKRCYKRG